MRDLIFDIDPNHDGKIILEEFIRIMTYIEQKQAQLPPIVSHQKSVFLNNGSNANIKKNSQASESAQDGKDTDRDLTQSQKNNSVVHGLNPNASLFSSEASVLDQEKRKYGALLPKSGVYFLPDDRIVAFLKIMNEMRKRFESVGNYMMANKFKKVFDRWS